MSPLQSRISSFLMIMKVSCGSQQVHAAGHAWGMLSLDVSASGPGQHILTFKCAICKIRPELLLNHKK